MQLGVSYDRSSSLNSLSQMPCLNLPETLQPDLRVTHHNYTALYSGQAPVFRSPHIMIPLDGHQAHSSHSFALRASPCAQFCKMQCTGHSASCRLALKLCDDEIGNCHVGHHNLNHAHRMTRHGTVSPPLVVDVHFHRSFRFVG